MKKKTLLLSLLILLLIFSTAFSKYCDDGMAPSVNSQGYLDWKLASNCLISPRHTYTLFSTANGGSLDSMDVSFTIKNTDGEVFNLDGIKANGWFISDADCLVTIQRLDTNLYPARIQVLDLDGNIKWCRDVYSLTNPTLSSSGQQFIYTDFTTTYCLQLTSLQCTSYPRFDLYDADEITFAGFSYASRSGINIFRNSDLDQTIPVDQYPLKLMIVDTDEIAVLFPDSLGKILPERDTIQIAHLSPSPVVRFRDMTTIHDTFIIGARNGIANEAQGKLYWVENNGETKLIQSTEVNHIPLYRDDGKSRDTIPWPYLPNEQHPVGNTYAAIQDFDPNQPYLHPGIDLMANPGTPVYAVNSGIVKAIITISGEWHWRVAVGDIDTPDSCEGFLYAHLIKNSIAVNVGEWVDKGQYLGNIIEFPTDFHHLHFARIRQSGTTWSGNWICSRNPHLLLENQTEATAPLFQKAYGNDMFAFCKNETSNYLDPHSLTGQVDIIARAYDKIDSEHEVAVQEMKLTIFPEGHPESPIIQDLQSFYFNLELDNYASGIQDRKKIPIFYKRDSTCFSKHNWDSIAYYFIATNSTGDQTYDNADLSACWDTTLYGDGSYVVSISAMDAKGNTSTESMTVNLVNGNQFTPTPTPEPTQHIDFGVRIDVPEMTHPGDDFSISGYLDNPFSAQYQVPVFFVLAISGQYWFWPDWVTYSPSEQSHIDYMELDIPTGTTPVVIIDPFIWPDTGQTAMSEMMIYGAMLSKDLNRIDGVMAAEEFAFGP